MFSCCPPRKSSVASRDATLHKQIKWFGCTSWYASHSAIWVILKLPPTCMWHDCWNQSGLWRWSQGCPEYTSKRTEEKVKKRRIKVRGSPYATSAAWLSSEDVAELQPEPSHAVFYLQNTWQTNKRVFIPQKPSKPLSNNPAEKKKKEKKTMAANKRKSSKDVMAKVQCGSWRSWAHRPKELVLANRRLDW